MNLKYVYLLFVFVIGFEALQSASNPTAAEVLSSRYDPQDRGQVVLTLEGSLVHPSTRLKCDGTEFVFKGYYAPPSFGTFLDRLKEAKMDMKRDGTGIPSISPKKEGLKAETIRRLIQQGSTASTYDSTVSRAEGDFFTADEILTTYRDAIAFYLLHSIKGTEGDITFSPVDNLLATTQTTGISPQDLPFHNAVILYAYYTTSLSCSCGNKPGYNSGECHEFANKIKLMLESSKKK